MKAKLIPPGSVAMGLTLLLLLVAVTGIPRILPPVPATAEIQVALILVLAVGVLMILLSLFAAGFAQNNLASKNRALGLPEGSVRALIAFFLLVIFIIMSVYLYRTLTDVPGDTLLNVTLAEIKELNQQIMSIQRNDAGTFDVVLRRPASDTAEQIALQLITILGTLVTAVSAFYFGSAAARDEVPARRSRDTPDGEP
jgi:hypothetical protein